LFFDLKQSPLAVKTYGILKDITASFIQNLVKLIGEKDSESLAQVNLFSEDR
jgi:hypothetical protein